MALPAGVFPSGANTAPLSECPSSQDSLVPPLVLGSRKDVKPSSDLSEKNGEMPPFPSGESGWSHCVRNNFKNVDKQGEQWAVSKVTCLPYMHVLAHVHTHIHTRVSLHAHVCTQACTYTDTCPTHSHDTPHAHTSSHACTQIDLPTCRCTHTHTYTPSAVAPDLNISRAGCDPHQWSSRRPFQKTW